MYKEFGKKNGIFNKIKERKYCKEAQAVHIIYSHCLYVVK